VAFPEEGIFKKAAVPSPIFVASVEGLIAVHDVPLPEIT
jgi:hypothetical protein